MMRIIRLMIFVGLLGGCPPSTLRPTITVTNSTTAHVLTVSGSGFANVATCANLSIQGLPAPSSHVAIGQPQCSNGSFQNYNWQYSYVGDACNPSSASSQTASVFAVDTQGSNAGASQSVSFDWGNTCALAGTCGGASQPACPGGGCSSGLVNSGGICVPCGAEGQPACSGSTPCQTGLHSNFQGGQVVCTWNCGHTQGAPCPSGTPNCGGLPPVLLQPQSPCVVPLIPPNLGQGGIYTCYYPGMIDSAGTCTCVPNTLNNCPISTSVPKPPAPNSGQCIQGQFKDNQGQGCF